MSESNSLFSLFISSLLGATLLPGGSEIVLFGVLKTYPHTTWTAISLATLGNTLGGMVSFAMGWVLPRTRSLKHADQVHHYGAPVLLLAWMPLIGDALCLAAGWLRLSIWQSILFMAVGKYLRYLIVVFVVHHS